MKTRNKIKMRKSLRYAYILIAIILLLISSSGLLDNLQAKDTEKTAKEIYSYTNKFNYDYTVNLIENKYIESKTLGMNETAYVTNLIDNINMNLNYTYSSKKQSDIECKYKVTGKLQAVYTRDGVEQKIWEKDYPLTEEKTVNSTGKEIKINENVILDLKEPNNLVRDFEQELGITVEAKYVVMLEVTTNTKVDKEEVENLYTPTVSIDLAQKTTTIKGDNNKENTEFVTAQVTENAEMNVTQVVVYSIMLIVAIIIIIYILTKTEESNKIKDEFRRELNRILRLCEDKIVKVSNNVDMSKNNIVEVKDFGEIIKVSEELFKPILYWYSSQNEEAWFCVVSNEITYRYILKKD